jgi:Spy/CpxP family protein refolding chaperone
MKECLLVLGSALITTFSVATSNTSKGIVPSLQYEDTAYTRVITERAGKIVATLGIVDSSAFYRVRGIVADQYRALNTIYNERDSAIKILKNQPAADKQAIDSGRKNLETNTTGKVDQLHGQYLTKLGAVLTPKQVEQVKDGMTYNVLDLTYRAYQDELPTLTEKQKARILADLTEAREHAMDGGSSKEKHAWFGKYKGRINNYLSAEGYDMKKAGAEWAERRKAAGK